MKNTKRKATAPTVLDSLFPPFGESPNLDFLPPCTADDFFHLEENSCSNGGDPQLFSVEQEQLQPISLPFLMPGIYRKVSTNPTASPPPADCGHNSPNVYVSDAEHYGGILRVEKFKNQYELLEPMEKSDNQQFRKARLLISGEQETFAEKSPPKMEAETQLMSEAESTFSMKSAVKMKSEEEALKSVKIKDEDEFSFLQPTEKNTIKRKTDTEMEDKGEFISEKKTMKMKAVEEFHQLRKDKGDYNDNDNGDEKKNEKLDALAQLAFNLVKMSNDHIIIDRDKLQIIRTERPTNHKIVYRIQSPDHSSFDSPELKSSPEYAELQQNIVVKRKSYIKRIEPKPIGRPRKDDESTEKSQQKIKEKELKKAELKPAVDNRPTFRTRFGRVVKLARPTLRPNFESNNNETTQLTLENTYEIYADEKDPDFQCKPKDTNTNTNPGNIDIQVPRRRIPPEAICPTCHKVFLGRRISRHFSSHPDHMIPKLSNAYFNINADTIQSNNYNDQDPPNNNSSLFRFLISKLQNSNLNEDQRADLFLNEINKFVQQLQLRSSRIIRNTSGLHFVTPRVSRVLGIPEGQYALDMSAIESPTEPEADLESESNGMTNFDMMNGSNLPAQIINPPDIDYTVLNISMDTITDETAQRLNLSVGGKLTPPSEESLLRAAGDFVDLKTLRAENSINPPIVSSMNDNESQMVPHYDHASDNAMEAMVPLKLTTTEQTPIDVSVDFFKTKVFN